MRRIRRTRKIVGKFFRSSWASRLLLLEAAVWLGLARLALLLVPFRRLAPILGRKMAESPLEDPSDPDVLERVAWAVRVASRYTPWKTKCLTEAMAGKAMLRRRGLASTLYLGLAKGGDIGLEAHAWLRCGSRILTGGELMDRYSAVARFAEVPRARLVDAPR